MRSQSDPYVRGKVEPCVLCQTPVDLTGVAEIYPLGHGVGHPMGETYEHYVCPNEAIQQRVRDLLREVYDAESVLVALWRIENLPDSALDDQAQYDTRWAEWKASRGPRPLHNAEGRAP